MILIYKNQTNKVIVTVTEKVTLTNPYFLFVFTNSSGSYSCVAENVSTTTYRFDEFNIVETDSPDTLDSEIELKAGTYTYKIYEQEEPDNLEIGATTSLVEQGHARVKGTESENSEHDTSTTNIHHE